ncbi:hypothetical protein Tco_1488726 [Tanacetum coccineum]
MRSAVKDLMALPYDESSELRWFHDRFPTYQLRNKPDRMKGFNFWVFSIKDEEGSQNNSYSSSGDGS